MPYDYDKFLQAIFDHDVELIRKFMHNGKRLICV